MGAATDRTDGPPACTSLSAAARLRAALNCLRQRAAAARRVPAAAAELTAGDILVLGAGLSGLTVAIKLKSAGLPFTVIDKEGDVGGTWLLNRYPGCACDVPAHLYSLSFEPNPDWSEAYAGAEEIHAYIKRVYEKYNLAPHTRLNTRLTRAEWTPSLQRWRVTLESGEILQPRFLFGCAGILHHPKTPAVPGKDKFKGRMFHSAEWDRATDFSAKKVVVVGSGASAVQFVPIIAEQAGRVVVLQRTPNWVIPRQDSLLPERHYPNSLKWAYRNVPLARAAYRASLYLKLESAITAGGLFDDADSRRSQLLRDQCQGLMASQLKGHKELRKKVIPTYPLGCKRICKSDDYLGSLTRPNVEVVVAGLAEVQEDGIVDTLGNKHLADIVIFGTGFEIGSIGKDVQIVGTGGFIWAGDSAFRQGQQAYLGTTMRELPNLFMLLGPNSGLGHNSVLLMAESQADYALRLLKEALAHDVDSFTVKPAVLRAYNQWVQEQLKDKVWSSCSSWYRADNGDVIALWPRTTYDFFTCLYNAPGLLEDYEVTRSSRPLRARL